MGDLVILIILGAIILAVGLWVFQHVGLVVAVLATLALLGVGLSLAKVAADYVRKHLERLSGWLRHSSRSGQGNALVGGVKQVSAEGEALSSSEPPIPSPREELLAAAERYRAELRRKEEQAYREHKRGVAEAEQRISEATEFVERTGLDSALIRIMETVRSWPAWTKNPEFAKYMAVPGVEAVTAEEERRDSAARRFTVRVTFVFEGKRYRIEFDDQGFFESSAYREIRFYDGERLVATMTVGSDLKRDYERWHLLDVKALELGEWVASALAVDSRIRTLTQEQGYQREAERLRAQAEHLPPSRPDPRG